MNFESYRNLSLAYAHYRRGRIGLVVLWEVARQAPGGYWPRLVNALMGSKDF
jgi:hypothetical protein